MEYFRDPKNQIQADLAYRIGRIAIQYGTFSVNYPREQQFDGHSSHLPFADTSNILC